MLELTLPFHSYWNRKHPLAAGRTLRDERTRNGSFDLDYVQLGCVLSLAPAKTTLTEPLCPGANLIIGSTFLSLIARITAAGPPSFPTPAPSLTLS